MELTAKQQITELIKNSQKILICTHANPDGDALGSTLALYLALKKIGKEVTAIAPSEPSKVFNFLPSIKELKTNPQMIKDFVISVDTSTVKIDKLGYKNNAEENKLNIILTPVNGNLSEEMVSFQKGNSKYDVIIVLDSSDLERLEKIYDNNTDLFYETPVINIDHHSGNDHFGRVNWIDLTATSTSEILVSLIESLGREKTLFDSEIATCLLTGLITDTGSFQHSNTTPKSFTVAAQLIAAGARQQEIIRHIFKTKALSTLKLWGTILSRIKEEHEYRFVWSSINIGDFVKANAREDESAGVVDELLKTAPGIDFALMLTERQDGVHGSLRGVQKGIDVSVIAKLFGGGGHELAAAFHLYDKTLAESEQNIIEKIKTFQREKLGLTNQGEAYVTGKKESSSTLEMPPSLML